MNAAKIVAAALVIVCLVVVAVLLMGQFTQTKPVYTQIMAYVTQAKDYVMKNFALVAGAIGGIVTLGGLAASLSSKLGAAKQQVSNLTSDAAKAETQAQNQLSTLQTDKTTLQQTITTHEATITDLKGQLTQAQSDVETMKAQVAPLQMQVSSLTSQAQALTSVAARAQVLADGKAVTQTVIK